MPQKILFRLWAVLLLLVGIFPWMPHRAQASSLRNMCLTSLGAEANGNSDSAALSPNGRYLVFTSYATNLIGGSTTGSRTYQVIVKDRTTGTLQYASLSNSGQLSNGTCSSPAITDSGRYVIFSSTGSNLVDNDVNSREDVFVRDMSLGTTQRISTGSDGTEANNSSFLPQITEDGRFAVFISRASNLTDGDTNGMADVMLRDIEHGITERISVSSQGTEGTGNTYLDTYSSRPAISADGNIVCFASFLNGLVPNDSNSSVDIFAYNRLDHTTKLISQDTSGLPAGRCANPSIDANGDLVSFESSASSLSPGDDYGSTDLFTADLKSGTLTLLTPGDPTANHACLSRDGKSLVFDSSSSDLVSGDTNGYTDVFEMTLATKEIKRVSIADDLGQGNASSTYPAVSGDGSLCAFQTSATNFPPEQTGRYSDVFLFNSLGKPDVHVISGRTLSFPPNSGYNGVTKTSLPSVTVVLRNAAGEIIGTKISDSTGSYAFRNKRPGSYSVSATLVRDGQPTINLDPASRDVTVTTADVPVPRLSLHSIFGVVNGKVATGAVGPKADAVVTLKNSFGSVVGTKTTLADGKFTFNRLPADTYSLSVTKAGFTFTDATDLVLPGTVAPIAPSLKRNFLGTKTATIVAPTPSGLRF